jgi:hypothetical protein
VDLVDEQHLVGREVGDDADQDRRLLDRRTGGRPHRHTHLVADDEGERCLAEPWRAVQQHVIERLGRAASRRAIADLQVSRGCRSWPMYSSSRRGRSPASYCASSSTRAAVIHAVVRSLGHFP